MMFVIRKHTGTLALFALGLCLMVVSQVLCANLWQLERLIRVPYPDSCSAEQVKQLFYMESALTTSWRSDETEQVKSEAIRLFNSYVHLLPAYCNRLFDMKMFQKENFNKFYVNYVEVADMSDKLAQLEHDNNKDIVLEKEFLRLLDQHLASKAAEKSISKQEALVGLKQAASKLSRLVYDEIGPMIALKRMANIVAPEEGRQAQEDMSSVRRNWIETSENLEVIGLVSMDSEGTLNLNNYLYGENGYFVDLASEEDTDDDEEDSMDLQSPLVPLKPQVVKQVTVDEGYQQKLDELAAGVERVRIRQ